jgi:predicted DNA-binding protein
MSLIAVRVPAELQVRIVRQAERERRTVSQMLRVLLERGLEEHGRMERRSVRRIISGKEG